MEFQTNTIKSPSYTAVIGNQWARQFPTQEQADAWAADIRGRLLWAEEIGLLKLVNGRDKQWGKNGWEYVGYHRDRGSCLTRLTYARICDYIGTWLTYSNVERFQDTFPISLTDKIKDTRRPPVAQWITLSALEDEWEPVVTVQEQLL